MEKAERVVRGRGKKMAVERGEAQSKTLRFRLILGTEEESPLTGISCITVGGLRKGLLSFWLSVRRSSCCSVGALYDPGWLDQ